MRMWTLGGAAVALMSVSAFALAAELQSGPSPGAPVGPFEVCKIAGAAEDGVSEGDELCYRCKYGNRPVVMVFTRSADEKVAKLAKELDSALASHKDKNLAAFVNFLGADRKKLAAAAKQLGANAKIAHVALVVPADNENGPAEYRLNPEADVTVVIYRDGKVKKNIAVAKNGLDDQQVQAIVENAVAILN